MTLRSILYSLFVLLLIGVSPPLLHAQWVRTNGPYGGRITDLVASGATLFVGTLGGGVFRSTDNGTSWTEASNGLTDFDVYVLAVSGTTLFAGFEEGIFRSTDNGDHWINLKSPITGKKVQSIAVVGTSIITATWDKGIYRSTDNGDNWVLVLKGLPEKMFGHPVNCLAVNEGSLFLSLHSGILRSIDSGASWTLVDSTGNLFSIQAIVFTDSTILVGTDYNGLLRFRDDGNRWTQIGTSVLDTMVHDMLVHGTNIFAGISGGGVRRSSDGGATWNAASPDIDHRSIQSLAAIGGTIFAGAWGAGVYRSSDNGATWIEANTGLSASTIDELFINDSNLFAAGYFMRRVYRTSNSGAEWAIDTLYDPDLNDVLITGDTIYVAGGENAIDRSTDNGVTWRPASAILDRAIVRAIVANDGYIFAATPSHGVFFTTPELDTSTALEGVLRSSDHGATWWEVNQGFEVREGFNSDRIPAVTSLLLKGDVLLAGTDQGLYRSTDNGDDWVAVNEKFPNDPYKYVGEMATNGSTIVISLYNGLYRSSDDGLTWNCIDANISVGALTAVGDTYFCSAVTRLRRDEPRTYILRSSDDGATWRSISEGITDNLYGTVFVTSATDLYLGTDGRGVWRRPLSDIVSDVNSESSFSIVGGEDIAIHPRSADSSITLSYRLDMRVAVTITIYDDENNIVSQPVVDEMQEAGEHQLVVQTGELATGVYLCSVNAEGVERTVRFVVVR
jgi:photosystem II stability/assembly factor-like uncharacterized protein